MRPLLPFVVLIALTPPPVHAALSLSTAACLTDSTQAAVNIRVPRHSLLSTYANMFELSDGSAFSLHLEEHRDTDAARNTVTAISNLFAHMGVARIPDPQDAEHITFQICTENVARILFFAVKGNFVTSPSDPTLAPHTDSETLASVVIDVYTNQLKLVNSISTIRTYFLETLLVLSIVAIARLGLVRNIFVTKKIE